MYVWTVNRQIQALRETLRQTRLRHLREDGVRGPPLALGRRREEEGRRAGHVRRRGSMSGRLVSRRSRGIEKHEEKSRIKNENLPDSLLQNEMYEYTLLKL